MFYTIQKTTFVIKDHFSVHSFVTEVLWSSLYFISLTVEKPLWDLTTNITGIAPLKLLAGSAPDLGENNFNELPMQSKWKLTLLLVSCYHQ